MLITISAELLEKLIPEIQGVEFSTLHDLVAKAQIEIDEIETIEEGRRIFKLKSISDFRTFSGLWVLIKELRLSLESYEKTVNLFDDDQDTEKLAKELFGKDPSSPTSQFLIREFLKNNPECKNYLEKFLKSEELIIERPKSILKLSHLSTIFEELKQDWVLKVIPKLRESCWDFTQINSDSWTVYWPPWYSQETLPPFSEILGRLLPLDQSSKPIRECMNSLTNYERREINTNFLDKWKEIRKYLISKGFIECNSSKFIEKTKNLKSQDYCLSYNKELTLRDNLHHSLVFEVLLKNLNDKKKLYPVFELSYCPWENCWSLGLASSIELQGSKDTNNFWYSVEEFKEFLRFIFEKFLGEKIEFVEPEKGEYLPQFSGALIYRLIVKNRVLGQLIIHRLEQFELRKKEVVSVSIKISYFS